MSRSPPQIASRGWSLVLESPSKCLCSTCQRLSIKCCFLQSCGPTSVWSLFGLKLSALFRSTAFRSREIRGSILNSTSSPWGGVSHFFSCRQFSSGSFGRRFLESLWSTTTLRRPIYETAHAPFTWITSVFCLPAPICLGTCAAGLPRLSTHEGWLRTNTGFSQLRSIC